MREMWGNEQLRAGERTIRQSVSGNRTARKWPFHVIGGKRISSPLKAHFSSSLSEIILPKKTRQKSHAMEEVQQPGRNRNTSTRSCLWLIIFIRISHIGDEKKAGLIVDFCKVNACDFNDFYQFTDCLAFVFLSIKRRRPRKKVKILAILEMTQMRKTHRLF